MTIRPALSMYPHLPPCLAGNSSRPWLSAVTPPPVDTKAVAQTRNDVMTFVIDVPRLGVAFHLQNASEKLIAFCLRSGPFGGPPVAAESPIYSSRCAC